MEQDEGATTVDQSEGNTEQGCEAPAPAVLAGEVAPVEEGVQERVLETDNPASEGAKKQDSEEPPPESGVESEDREAFEDTIATRFEFRAAAASTIATPPPTSLLSRSRSRNQAGPTKFTASGDAEPAGSDAPALGASSSSSGPAKVTYENVPAMDGGHQGAALGDDKKMKRVCSEPGAKVAIAHASPRDSYRRIPWRSRKQYSPKRFVAAAGAPPPDACQGFALPSASASGLRLGTGADATASSGVIDASASSSCSNRPPSRGRKQKLPAHFIPEEEEATASAKARRSDIVLDRFLSSHVRGSSVSHSEWVKNVTAEDDAVRGDRPRGVEGFRIRDASRHATRALSRLGCASPSSSASPPGEPGGRGRSYGVLAVLGAGLALIVATCVLFYVVGQRSEPGPPVEKPDE